MFRQLKIVGLAGAGWGLSLGLISCGQKGPLALPQAIVVEQNAPSISSETQNATQKNDAPRVVCDVNALQPCQGKASK
jgi:predicted small lipoprotein YifL